MAQSAVSNDLASSFGLKGRCYVITGGAQGIGLAISKAIAQVGGNVVAIDIQNQPKPEFLDFSGTFGVKAVYIQGDVTNEASLKAAFGRAVDAVGMVHGCVTCAGIAIEKPFEEHTWEEVRRVMDVNVSHSLLHLFLLFYVCSCPCDLITLASSCTSSLSSFFPFCLTIASRSLEPTSHHSSQLSR